MDERKQRFVDIHKNARIECHQSQEYMAFELNVSKKTIQNWEKGISEPSFYESLEWFRALRVNPLPLYMSIISENKALDVTPDMSDDKMDEALLEVIKALSPQSKRALLYLFIGKHGSSAYSILQLLLAHLHLPLKERLINASTVFKKYETEKKLDNLICKDNILPDIDNLKNAINKAQESVEQYEFGYYNIVH